MNSGAVRDASEKDLGPMSKTAQSSRWLSGASTDSFLAAVLLGFGLIVLFEQVFDVGTAQHLDKADLPSLIQIDD
jgi:hypothetical protein